MFTTRFLWKPVVHRMVTGRWRRLRMLPGLPQDVGRFVRPGIYLHVPFCRNLCPFCAYNRIAYDADLFAAYEAALFQEIELNRDCLDGQRAGSLYIGGGTPTVNLDGLLRIIEGLKQAFGPFEDICVELHPAAMAGPDLRALKAAGATMLSVGVEAVTDRVLAAIGRNHDGRTALDSLALALDIGFEAVNADLMFALPGQSLEDWGRDLDQVLATGVHQISTYPLFTFPYSDLGQSRRIRAVRKPRTSMVKAMLRLTDDLSRASGLERCAVWSWIRPERKKFSSVTRHHYLGFGPSAASMSGSHFWVNTFDVKAYVRAMAKGRAASLAMDVDRRLEMAYWFYWRIYELAVRQEDFAAVFGPQADMDAVFAPVMRPFVLAGMAERDSGGYRITDRGAYWIHRLQNEYSLNYINRLWGASRREAWPRSVVL